MKKANRTNLHSYAEMLKLAQAHIANGILAEQVAKHCSKTGTSLRHGLWEMQGKQGLCYCSPCTQARGEKPICL